MVKYLSLLGGILLSVLILAAFLPAISFGAASTIITGRVTFNGTYQDDVTVSVSGANSDITKNGGYYNITSVPANIAVFVTASYMGHSQKKALTTGEPGSYSTLNFELNIPPTPTPLVLTPGENPARLTGTVKYKGDTLVGAPINVSPFSIVYTDANGRYTIPVPPDTNLTVSIEISGGSASKDIVTPGSGKTMIVDLVIPDSSVPCVTPAAITGIPAAITGIPAAITGIPTTLAVTVTTVPSPAKATATPAAGSEIIVLLSLTGLLCAATLIGKKL